MLKFLEEEEWLKLVSATRKLLLNEQPAVVAALAENFKLVTKYSVFLIKDKPVITFIAYTAGKQIKAPIHFFYSAFWIDEKLSETKSLAYLNNFLLELQKLYQNIEIRLPITITDARPFIWAGFKIENRYTYVKGLETLSYHEITEKNIKKATAKEYILQNEPLSEASLLINLKIFKDLKVYSASQLKQLSNLLFALFDSGYLTCYNVYMGQELLASNILFLDEVNGIAYTVLLNQVKRENKDDLHSLLYAYFFKALSAKGYLFVDLLGADIAGIAAFKSRFNPQLYPHFFVKYSSRNQLISHKVAKLKHLVKRILR